MLGAHARGGQGPVKVEAVHVNTIWGFPKIRGYLFEGSYKKDYSTLGSIWGYPNLGKLPYKIPIISVKRVPAGELKESRDFSNLMLSLSARNSEGISTNYVFEILRRDPHVRKSHSS